MYHLVQIAKFNLANFNVDDLFRGTVGEQMLYEIGDPGEVHASSDCLH